MKAWFILILAGILEVGWAIGMKYTNGWTQLMPSVLTVLSMVISFILLSYAVKTLPIGTAYAIWVGIGAIGVSALGVILFGEGLSLYRLLFLLLIFTGIIGLKLTA
jgi:quaternary ammonium compound-resistance protein SugE